MIVAAATKLVLIQSVIFHLIDDTCYLTLVDDGYWNITISSPVDKINGVFKLNPEPSSLGQKMETADHFYAYYNSFIW